MGIAILIAAVLVQEVQYVRVVNGQGPTGPEINQHTIKRVGPDGFQSPYHITLLFILFSICLSFLLHTISFFLLLVRYGEDS